MSPSTPVDEENAAVLFYCKAPEMSPDLPIGTEMSR